MSDSRKLLEECRAELQESIDNEGRLASFTSLIKRIDAFLAAPPAAERDSVIEECARVCEEMSLRYFGKHGQGAATNCAVAIRALKSTERKEG